MSPWYAPAILPAVLLLGTAPLAADIQPYRAQEPKAFQAQEVAPARAREPAVSPPAARAPATRSPADIAVFQAEEATRLPPAGVDPVASPRPFDARAAGSWALTIPSASWTTRTQEGPHVVDTTRSGVGAGMGTLRIDARGRYVWLRHGQRISHGDVREVRPRIGADAGSRYWQVRNEREAFYLTVSAGRLTLYSVTSNSFVASGQRR